MFLEFSDSFLEGVNTRFWLSHINNGFGIQVKKISNWKGNKQNFKRDDQTNLIKYELEYVQVSGTFWIWWESALIAKSVSWENSVIGWAIFRTEDNFTYSIVSIAIEWFSRLNDSNSESKLSSSLMRSSWHLFNISHNSVNFPEMVTVWNVEQHKEMVNHWRCLTIYRVTFHMTHKFFQIWNHGHGEGWYCSILLIFLKLI